MTEYIYIWKNGKFLIEFFFITTNFQLMSEEPKILVVIYEPFFARVYIRAYIRHIY